MARPYRAAAGTLWRVKICRYFALPMTLTADPAKRYEKASLPLIFSFAAPLQHGEAGLFGVGNRERLELHR